MSTIHILRICVGVTSDNIPESSRRRSHGLSWGGVISFEEESGHGDGKEDQKRELAVEDAELSYPSPMFAKHNIRRREPSIGHGGQHTGDIREA